MSNPTPPEDRQFLEALTGERQGSPAEQALRADLLAMGRLQKEIAEDDGVLSPDQEARRTRLIARLKQEGLLQSKPKTVGRSATPDAFGQLLSWLGIQVSGSGVAVSPVAALSLAVAVGGATYFATATRQSVVRGGDVLRSGARLEIDTANPTARCKAIEGALTAAKIEKGRQIVLSLDSEHECRVTVLNMDEEADRGAAAAIFRALGFEVEPQARLELIVRRTQ